MRRYFVRKGLCLALAAAFLALSGCGEDTGQDRENPSGDNRESGYDRSVNTLAKDAGGNDADGLPGKGTDVPAAITDFGVRLLQQTMAAAETGLPSHASMPESVNRRIERGENILVSPLSVLTALAMVGGGARGETLTQMEEVFGISRPELSEYLSVYGRALPAGEKYRLSMADSVWFTEDKRFTVQQDFLDTSKELFGAEIYRTPFDASTVREINGWVKENTEGMIGEFLDQIPPDTVMCLVNALAFDAEWQEGYSEAQIREGMFITQDETAQKAEMMYSSESRYLEDEGATGFLKYYADEKYAFAALLPREGTKVTEYLASLTGEKLRRILDNPIEEEVDICIPKYESEYAVELKEILQSMGMADAFSASEADFTGIGSSENGNVYISRVLHKTCIAVDERGTKAGAAAAVVMEDGAAPIEEPDTKEVYLDRPFVYLIIDCEPGLPIFLGVVMEIEGNDSAAVVFEVSKS